MDTYRFQVFLECARQKNFSRAAEILHIAQPPLSRQIQQLEDELGVLLIDRSSRPLDLTEAGRFFYEQSGQIMARIEHMREQTRKIGLSKRERYVIGCVGSTLYGGMPDLVRRMRMRWPDLDIEIREMMSTEQVTALKERRIDLMIPPPGVDSLRPSALGSAPARSPCRSCAAAWRRTRR